MSQKIKVKQPLNIEAVRQKFPIFSNHNKHRGQAHLNNAATTHKPLSVVKAVSDFYQHENANVHRASKLISQSATTKFELARDKVRQFLNAKHMEEVIWTKGATESINLVANSWGLTHLQADDEILLMESEHHANIVPWQQIAAKTGAKIRVAPIIMDAKIDMAAFEKLLSNQTRIVGVAHVSNATGRINPVKEIVRLAHKYGALVLIDGAQAVSHFRVDVQALDCDFYVISGHKMYGPNGIGVLYGKREHLEKMSPWQTGGGMVSNVSFDITETTFNCLPFKFEAGTPNIASALGLAAAIEYLNEYDQSAIIEHETKLLMQLYDGLKAMPSIDIIGEKKHRAGVISFIAKTKHHHDLNCLLGDQGVVLRSGHHCAMPLMQALGITGTLRVSVAMYTSEDEIKFFLKALSEALNATDKEETLLRMQNLPDRTQVFRGILKNSTWSSRYKNIIKLGNKIPQLPIKFKKKQYLMPNCESQVWLAIDYDIEHKIIKCYADSDSGVMRGLIYLLLSAFDQRSPQAVIDFPLLAWFEKLGLLEHLSPTRGNGIKSMVDRVYSEANKWLVSDNILP